MGVPAGRAGRVVLAVRCLLSAAGLGLWWWGVRHWPHPPFDAYGPGFQAWALSFVVLLAAWMRPPRWRSPVLDRWSWCVLVLFALAAALRFYHVTTAPYVIHFDEVNGFTALEEMRRGVAENIFSRIDYIPANPGLLVGLEWVIGLFAPNRFVAHRYAAATFGSLSLVTTYLLARRLWSRRVAMVATFALAFSYWHFVSSRFQSFFPSTPFAAALMWWLLLRATGGTMLDAVVAGIAMGLGLMLYNPIKVMLVAVPCWWLWHAVVRRGFARRTLLPVLVAGGVAAMVLTPLLQRNGWQGYFYRAEQVTVLGPAFRADLLPAMVELPAVAARQLGRLARMVTGGAELAANHYSAAPLLNIVELALALLGLLFCCRRWRSWRATIAPIWLFLTVAGVSLSSVPEASYRLAVALPAFALLIAVGAVTSFDFLRGRLRGRRARRLLTLAAIGLATCDVGVNASRSLTYLTAMNRASELTILARAIAQGARDARYYVETTPNETERVTFLALTHTHSVVTVADLVDQVPRVVDSRRPAVFAIPRWAREYSLRYLRQLYPRAKTRAVSDPSGHLGGYLVEVPAGMTAHSPRDTCGLRRGGCIARVAHLDPYVSFLDLRQLCPGERRPRIEWRGTIDLPDSPRELGVVQNYTSTSIVLDGQLVLDSSRSGEAPIPLCLRPGAHSLHIVTDVMDGSPTTIQLWWRRPYDVASVIPCDALTPLPVASPTDSRAAD